MPANSRFSSSNPRHLIREEKDGGKLWIEKADDNTVGDEGLYWFMWYGPSGARLKTSAVFTKKDLLTAVGVFMGVPDAQGT